MIEVLNGTQGDIFAVKVSGKLTDKEYKETLIPKLQEAIKASGKIKLFCHMDDKFEGWEMHAAWDDLSFWLKYKDQFKKVAVVGGSKWIDIGTKLSAHIMSGAVKVFPEADLQKAWDWIKA